MSWEEEVAKRGKKFQDRNAEDQNKREAISFNLEQVICTIEKHNDNLVKAGVNVNKKHSPGYSYDVNYNHHGICGSINMYIAKHDIATGISYKNSRIFIIYSAHSCRKKLIKKYISPDEAINWIKFATRQPNITDMFRKLTGTWHGEV